MKRVDIINIDAWVIQFFKETWLYENACVSGFHREFWQNAINTAPSGLISTNLFISVV